MVTDDSYVFQDGDWMFLACPICGETIHSFLWGTSVQGEGMAGAERAVRDHLYQQHRFRYWLWLKTHRSQAIKGLLG